MKYMLHMHKMLLLCGLSLPYHNSEHMQLNYNTVVLEASLYLLFCTELYSICACTNVVNLEFVSVHVFVTSLIGYMYVTNN